MAKPARITRGKHTGRHHRGGPQQGRLLLRAGAKGTGRILHSVRYWPWSPLSCDAADDVLFAAAERLGYEIVQEPS